MKALTKSTEINGKTLTLETGKLAGLASAAVVARMGDTMVLATVVSGPQRPELGYFPLTVEYSERLYAGGRIKGSRWVKREGRPTDEAILSARLIDRSIRPLFPKEYFNEIQVIITILSVDSENDPAVLSIVAASAALSISDIPWNGPIGAVRMGYITNPEIPAKEATPAIKTPVLANFVANPTDTEMEYSSLDLVISGSKEAIVMVEAGAKEVSEENVLTALKMGHEEIKKIIKLIEEFTGLSGCQKKKITAKPADKNLELKISKRAESYIEDLLSKSASGKGSENSLDEVKDLVYLEFKEEDMSKADILALVEKKAKELTRKRIVERGIRPDGRKPKEIRPIDIEVSILPRTHGSAIFKRGQTQALTIATLGAPSLKQYFEFATGEETKRYIHHYNMPPYSVGETGRTGWPARREIGHGALAERALFAVIPSEDKFPYTIRVVSEIMASNGSTSMASVCGSTLALMDAGVPISQPVAGIAMGLITVKSGDKKPTYVILSDIIGFEDFFGDMDFKVAGTKNGITALQLDVKISGLTLEIFKEAFSQAKEGRMFILEKMLKVMPVSRSQLSKYAPRVNIMHIPVDKIGELIGPGGKMIRKIIAETGATVDVEDDGSVNITATNPASMAKAVTWVESLTKEVKAGEEYTGTVKRIQPFGAFVEILPGKDGLVHVSQMSAEYVSDPSTIVSLGAKVKVRVVNIDDMGRINLSMLFGSDAQKAASRPKTFSNQNRPQGRPNDRMKRWH